MINPMELTAISNHIKDAENELYELSVNFEAELPEEVDIYIDKAFGSLDYARDFVDDLLKATQKEQDLIKGNETLKALYKEYTTVRDLIGSEE